MFKTEEIGRFIREELAAMTLVIHPGKSGGASIRHPREMETDITVGSEKRGSGLKKDQKERVIVRRKRR